SDDGDEDAGQGRAGKHAHEHADGEDRRGGHNHTDQHRVSHGMRAYLGQLEAATEATTRRESTPPDGSNHSWRASRMPECLCPEELGGACHLDPVTEELTAWMAPFWPPPHLARHPVGLAHEETGRRAARD